MEGYTKNQTEHFKEQLKLLMKSRNLTALVAISKKSII